MLELVLAHVRHFPLIKAAQEAIGDPVTVTNEALELAAAAASPKQSRGRPRVSDDIHQIVAECYIEVVQQRGSRGAHQLLAKRLSKRLKRPISPTQSRDLTFRARQRGFLAKTKEGRAMPAPGPAFVEQPREPQ